MVAEKPRDLPREQLIKHAQRTLSKMKRGVVYFKYTCHACNTRMTLEEPNKLYERGECNNCGHVQDIEEGGYLYSSSELKKKYFYDL